MNITNVSLLLLLFVVVFVIVTARVQNKFTKKFQGSSWDSNSRMSDALITKSLGPELEEWKTCYISRIAKRPAEFQITQNWTEQDVTKIMN